MNSNEITALEKVFPGLHPKPAIRGKLFPERTSRNIHPMNSNAITITVHSQYSNQADLSEKQLPDKLIHHRRISFTFHGTHGLTHDKAHGFLLACLVISHGLGICRQNFSNGGF